MNGMAYNGQFALMQNFHNRYKNYLAVHNTLDASIPKGLYRIVEKVVCLYDNDMPCKKGLSYHDIKFLSEQIWKYFPEIEYLGGACSYGPDDKKPWMVKGE
jgi:hypothetical protein